MICVPTNGPNITCRAILLISTICLICILGTASALYVVARNSLLEHSTAEVEAFAVETQGRVEATIDHAVAMIAAQAKNPGIPLLIERLNESGTPPGDRRTAHENLRVFLSGWTGTTMMFARLFAVDGETGAVIAATGDSDTVPQLFPQEFLEIGRTEAMFHAPRPATGDGPPDLLVSAPVESESGRVVALLVAKLSPDGLHIPHKSDGKHLGVMDDYLVGPGGFLVTVPRLLPIGASPVRQFQVPAVDSCLGGRSTIAESVGYHGEAVFGSYRWIQHLGMCLVTEIRRTELLKPIDKFTGTSTGLALIGLVIAIGLGTFMARRIVRPISDLCLAVKRVSIGDKSVRVERDRRDEIGDLAHRFNEMTANLEFAENRLRESEERFALAMKGANDGLWDWNLETDQAYYSPRWKSMLGFEDSEIGTSSDEWKSRLHPDDRDAVTAAIDRHLKGEADSFEFEFRMRHKDGHYVDILSRGFAVRDESGRPERCVGTHVDITKRRRAEAKLRTLFRAVEQSPNSVIITNSQGEIEYVNPKFVEISGYSRDEAIGQSPRIMKSGETQKQDYDALWKSISSGQEWHGVFHNRRQDGSYYWAETSISPVRGHDGTITHFIGIQKDISARLELQNRLRQSERMESLGSLAGGIAHDFNNMLLPIQSLTAMILRDTPEDSSTARRLKMVLEASHRAGELVKRILAFSRSDAGEKIPQEIAKVVADAIALLGSTIPSTVRIRSQIRNVGTVLMDASQIQTVLLNLAVNGVHAMNGKPGNLDIELSQFHLDGTLTSCGSTLSQGEYAKLRLSDDGCGMDSDTLHRIFDPFFTTKPVGEGTGLGLSMVYGIVKQHDGLVTVSSAVGKGTTFDIYFPLEIMDATDNDSVVDVVDQGSAGE